MTKIDFSAESSEKVINNIKPSVSNSGDVTSPADFDLETAHGPIKGAVQVAPLAEQPMRTRLPMAC